MTYEIGSLEGDLRISIIAEICEANLNEANEVICQPHCDNELVQLRNLIIHVSN